MGIPHLLAHKTKRVKCVASGKRVNVHTKRNTYGVSVQAMDTGKIKTRKLMTKENSYYARFKKSKRP